jgi:hypothetical protein
MDRRIAQDKTIGFALGLGKQDRTATGIDFSGDTWALVQVSQRSTLRLEVGITLLSPLALSTRLIKLLVWLSAKLT